jgi:hypothetical protein
MNAVRLRRAAPAAAVLLAALLLVARSPLCRAADAPPAAAALPAAIKAEARQRFDLGLRLFETGDNAAALAEFKRAYELIPNVLVLYNIGLVYAAMNRPVDAADALEKSLTEAGDHLSADQRARARQVRDEQAARIAQVLVLTDQPANIEIDGMDVGRTPLSQPLRVASGAHTISALATGYLPSRQQVTLAGKVTETVTLTLLPTESSVAHLALTVAVPGAEVLINGKPVGVTPLPATVAVPPGATRVEVRRPGYRTATRTMRVDEGASGALELTLEEDPAAPATLKGGLRLALSEPAAEVTIDGAARARAADGLPLSLVVGPHLLRVERAGFQPFEQRVEITAGAETSLAISLSPTLETKTRSQDNRRWLGWSLIAGGALIAVGASVYTVVTRNDISQAEAQLGTQLALEMNPADPCFAGPNPPNPGYYEARGCGPRKAAYRDDVDAAKLHRYLAYGGIGLGALVAGAGSYLILSGNPAARAHESLASRLGVWNDGQGGGLLLTGRF